MKNDLPGVVSSMLPVDDDKLKEFANVDVTNLTERRYLKVMFLMLCYIFFDFGRTSIDSELGSVDKILARLRSLHISSA